MSSSATPILHGSHIIKARWKIVKRIGQGAFGEIHQAKNVITGEIVAVKIERVDNKKQVLKLEVAVLKRLQECPYVCRFIACGRFADYNYIVMELLGSNLSELRRRQSEGRFSMTTTLKLGQQMLNSIEACHDLGYLHRDIKPSNFAMGLEPSKKGKVFLIDFGLARRYVLNTGEVRPARDSTGFRGTARYASIHSHLSRDLGRRDDLWSLLYVLIEFANGSLPWRKIKDKDQIGEMKIELNKAELVLDLPSEFLAFMQHLQSLQYEDRPDYTYLRGLLLTAYENAGGDEFTPFDWELPHISRSPSVSAEEESRKENGKESEPNGAQPFSASRFGSPSRNKQKTPPGDLNAASPLVFGSPKYSYVPSAVLVEAPATVPKQHRRSSSLPINWTPLPERKSSPQNPFAENRSEKGKKKKKKNKDSVMMSVLDKPNGSETTNQKMPHEDYREKNKCCPTCVLI